MGTEQDKEAPMGETREDDTEHLKGKMGEDEEVLGVERKKQTCGHPWLELEAVKNKRICSSDHFLRWAFTPLGNHGKK